MPVERDFDSCNISPVQKQNHKRQKLFRTLCVTLRMKHQTSVVVEIIATNLYSMTNLCDSDRV